MPREAQFAAVKALLDDGIIKHAGLSEVAIADIKAASQVFPVATVQNRYNLVDRGSKDVLEYCDQRGIGFIPWYPLAAGELAKSGSILDRVAKAHGATPGQIALAWLLKLSPIMLPIPGTTSRRMSRRRTSSSLLRNMPRSTAKAAPNTPRLDAPHSLAGATALPVSCP